MADSASSVDSVARRKDLRGNTVGTKRRDVGLLHEQKGVWKKPRVSPSRAIVLDSARTGTSRDKEKPTNSEVKRDVPSLRNKRNRKNRLFLRWHSFY